MISLRREAVGAAESLYQVLCVPSNPNFLQNTSQEEPKNSELNQTLKKKAKVKELLIQGIYTSRSKMTHTAAAHKCVPHIPSAILL